MYLLRISLILTSFLILAPISSYAGEKEGWVTRTEHMPHPPHDHHENDHLKYIRGHGSDRKKKVAMK